jgi:hypothetical protein
MSKFTRRFKIYKNKTIKPRVSSIQPRVSSIQPRVSSIKKGGKYGELHTSHGISKSSEYPEREGIIDHYENKLSEATSTVTNFAIDTGLKMIGLKRIKSEPTEINEEPRIVSNVENTVDKAGSTVLGNVNEVLHSDSVQKTTEQAAKDTAEIIKLSAKKFNEALDHPEVKSEIKQAINNAGEFGSVIVEAGKKPFNDAVDIAAEASQKATSAALSGAVKVGTDVLAAVPFLGAIVDLGKMVNDGSRAASAVTEASSEAIEATADAFIETKKNIETKLKELEEKKRISQQISNRTTNSIKEFEAPIASQVAGGYKTRRRLFKHKAKTKRVRFSI